MKDEITKGILKALAANGKLSPDDLALQFNITAADAAAEVARLEREHSILGYHAVIQEGELENSEVKAIIEVHVRPERDGGFDRIARRLSKFPQVVSLYLMSGGYDLMVEVKGNNLNEVAMFVASKLATIDGVLGTGTHFLLKKYKEAGILFQEEEKNERLKIVP